MPAGQPVVAEDKRTVVANTYYTLIDYTGEGMLTNINFYVSTSEVHLLTVKITVDGAAAVVIDCINVGYTNQRDYANDSRRVMSLDWGLIKFATSLKVEYKHAAVPYIRATCFYQTN